MHRQRCPFCAHARTQVAWRGVARSEPLNPLGPSGNRTTVKLAKVDKTMKGVVEKVLGMLADAQAGGVAKSKSCYATPSHASGRVQTQARRARGRPEERPLQTAEANGAHCRASA